MNSPNSGNEINIYPKQGTVADRSNPRANSDPYAFTPYKSTYEERKKDFLQKCAKENQNTLIGGSASAYLGKTSSVPDNIIDLYVKRLNERFDCTDFFAIHIIHALYINQKHSFLTAEQQKKLSQALLDFKYWADEPGHNYMIMYTENHQILFHSIEYLAGQLLSNETFTNNGKSGRWHQQHAAKLALKWMERRAKWGFNEWSSNVYFAKDVESLLLLAEFAENNDFAKAAAIPLDIVLLEIAFNQFYGFHASTHGRAYDKEILSGWDNEVATLVKVIWGLGTFSEEGTMAALLLASAKRYKPSDVIIRIGQEHLEEFINYERNGILLSRLEDYGIRKDNLEDVNFIWGMAAFSHPEVIDLFVKACDAWNLWELPFFDFLSDKHHFLPRDGTLGNIIKKVDIDFNRTLLDEVNFLTYRTPDYMLSTAQNYRPGKKGYQHHIWQATLSPNAVVFTTNPGATKYVKESISPAKLEYRYELVDGEKPQLNRLPSYWAGQNRLPKAIQYKNIAFILYNINMKKATGESIVYDFTHAFFPKWAFDEVIESDGWIFGKVENGYIALYSTLPYFWNEPEDTFAHDVVSNGTKNIWICQLGNKAKNGGFANFKDRILNSQLNFDIETLNIEFSAPELGDITVSWENPLVIDGNEIPLSNYKRMSNQYCQSEFDSGTYIIEQGGERLTLDIINLIRNTEKID